MHTLKELLKNHCYCAVHISHEINVVVFPVVVTAVERRTKCDCFVSRGFKEVV